MEFKDKQAIYLQIAEYISDQILLKKWHPGDKIISIRELAVLMEVNPNTIQRACDYLQQASIITNKRGIGYFIEQNAETLIINLKKEQFIKDELPMFFRSIYLLNLNINEIKVQYEQFLNSNFKSNENETK